MDEQIRQTLLASLEIKEASIKRAKKTAASPRFDIVYDAELVDITTARKWVNDQKAAR